VLESHQAAACCQILYFIGLLLKNTANVLKEEQATKASDGIHEGLRTEIP